MTTKTTVFAYGGIVESFMQKMHEMVEVVSVLEADYCKLMVDHVALTEQMQSQHEKHSSLLDEHAVLIAERDYLQKKCDTKSKRLKNAIKAKNKIKQEAKCVYRIQAQYQTLQVCHDKLIKEHTTQLEKHAALQSKCNHLTQIQQRIHQLIGECESDSDDCMIIE